LIVEKEKNTIINFRTKFHYLIDMYDYLAIIAGIFIICIFIFIVITDGWKILNFLIKKFLSR